MYMQMIPDKVRMIVEELKRCEHGMWMEYEKISEIQRNLERVDQESLWEALLTWKKQREALEQGIKRLQRLQMALENAVERYEKCEQKILAYEDGTEKEPERYEVKDFTDLKEKLEAYQIEFQ